MKLMMNKSVEEALVPWEFVVENTAGNAFRTRPPTLGELAVIDQFGKKDARGLAVVSLKSLLEVVQKLFVDAPEGFVACWGLDDLNGFVEAYGEYFAEHAKKKREAKLARAALAKAAMGGSGK